MTALLSIITVTRNNGAGLNRTLRSSEGLLADPRIEMVVVDGASTDDTADYLAQWRDRVTGQVVVLSEPDNGIYDAMNKGLRLATGRHVIFMNAGDAFAESFRVDVTALRDGTVHYGDAEFLANSGTYIKRYEIKGIHAFLNHNTFCHQAIFYPRPLLVDLDGYDVSYGVSADFDLTLKCFLRRPFKPLGSVVCTCELGGFSHIHGWRSYEDRMRSIRAHCGVHWWLLLRLYAPVFLFKHMIVKALDDSRLLSWYRSLRYR